MIARAAAIATLIRNPGKLFPESVKIGDIMAYFILHCSARKSLNNKS